MYVKKVLFLVVLYCIVPQGSEAALLYLDPPNPSVHRGDTVTLSLRLDTDTAECVNTVDAVIKYDPSIRAVDVSRGDSILSLWVENPTIDETNHEIRFAGGIPGGYCGRIPGDPRLTNVVLDLVFRSPGLNVGGGDNQTARVWVDDTAQVLLHDGAGTPAALRIQDATIALLSTIGTSISDSWNETVVADTDLPSDFAIELTRDEVAFDGKYFIVFNSLDKQSGIDHYEVMEEPISELYTFKWGRADAPWERTDSPYLLKDQTLNSTIRVKAIDKAGNERIVTLVPDVALRSLSRDRMIIYSIAGALLVVVLGFGGYALMKRRRRPYIESQPHEETLS